MLIYLIRIASRPVAVVDEAKLEVDGKEVYVWAAIDVIHVECRPPDPATTHSALKETLTRCRGQPVKINRGSRDTW